MPRRSQGFEPRARGSRKAPPQPAQQHLWGLIATLLHFGHGTQQPQLLDVADPSWGCKCQSLQAVWQHVMQHLPEPLAWRPGMGH